MATSQLNVMGSVTEKKSEGGCCSLSYEGCNQSAVWSLRRQLSGTVLAWHSQAYDGLAYMRPRL